MKKVSDLERKQVHDLGKPNVQDDNNYMEKQFYTNVIIGTALERIINNQDIKKQRFFVKTICTYLNKPVNVVVGLLGNESSYSNRLILVFQSLKMMYDYKLNLVARTPRACPWE